MKDNIEEIKDELKKYLMGYYSKGAERSLREERAEKEIAEILSKIERVDFTKWGDWEEYIPGWIAELWPRLSNNFKLLIYFMANKCKDQHEADMDNSIF